MSRFRDFSKVPGGQIDWDAIKQESRALSDNEMDVRRANVPKITPVKEGQQHPVGKHGQLKLFHEHVWPKGYTPERMNQVADVTNDWIYDTIASDHSGHFKNKVMSSIARSTIPIQDIQSMSEYGHMALTENTDLGEFDMDDSLVMLNPNTALGGRRSISKDPSGTMASQVTIHELGHLDDYMRDPDDFYKQEENRTPYSGDFPSPGLEGRAEGYRLAHNRVTRGMQRFNRAIMRPTARYDVKGFQGTSRKVFELNRLKSFRFASGLDPYPRITETPQPEERTHPVLPGMEPYV